MKAGNFFAQNLVDQKFKINYFSLHSEKEHSKKKQLDKNFCLINEEF